MWLFGEGDLKNPFEQAMFYLDEDAKAALTPNQDGVGSTYKPTDRRVVWTKVNKMGNNAVHLFELPKGEHVLSIYNNETPQSAKGAGTTVSHIVAWP